MRRSKIIHAEDIKVEFVAIQQCAGTTDVETPPSYASKLLLSYLQVRDHFAMDPSGQTGRFRPALYRIVKAVHFLLPDRRLRGVRFGEIKTMAKIYAFCQIKRNHKISHSSSLMEIHPLQSKAFPVAMEASQSLYSPPVCKGHFSCK